MHFRQSTVFGTLVSISLVLAFILGFLLRDFTATGRIPAPAVLGMPASDYRLLSEVQTLLDTHFIREQPSPAEREYAAIRGMLSALEDRYTIFIDPPVAQSESDVLAGTYGGVGVQVQKSESGELIIFPLPDSPAERAGIASEDVLLQINGQPVAFDTPQDVIDQSLRGEVKSGNGVTLVLRRGSGAEREYFVEFGVINIPSVIWRLHSDDARIGYVQVLRFTDRTPEELQQALSELADLSIEALILDLRNNSGGLLQESVEVADQFLQDGIILIERNTAGEEIFTADADIAVEMDLPMVVLVNGQTASAAELVVGALQDRRRAIAIGQRTYGKGSVQHIFRLSDESSLHVTSAEWLTPERTHIDGQGLEPDIAMIPDQNGRDVELGEAIRYLREQLG